MVNPLGLLWYLFFKELMAKRDALQSQPYFSNSARREKIACWLEGLYKNLVFEMLITMRNWLPPKQKTLNLNGKGKLSSYSIVLGYKSGKELDCLSSCCQTGSWCSISLTLMPNNYPLSPKRLLLISGFTHPACPF